MFLYSSNPVPKQHHHLRQWAQNNEGLYVIIFILPYSVRSVFLHSSVCCFDYRICVQKMEKWTPHGENFPARFKGGAAGTSRTYQWLRWWWPGWCTKREEAVQRRRPVQIQRRHVQTQRRLLHEAERDLSESYSVTPKVLHCVIRRSPCC